MADPQAKVCAAAPYIFETSSSYASFANEVSNSQTSTPAVDCLSNPSRVSDATPPPVVRLTFNECAEGSQLFCSEPHVVLDSGIDSFGSSKLVFADSAANWEAETEVEISNTERDDTKCARCGCTFPRKKKPHKGLLRFSLSYLNVTHPSLTAAGNFVCSTCRKHFWPAKRQRSRPACSSTTKQQQQRKAKIELSSENNSSLEEVHQMDLSDSDDMGLGDHNYFSTKYGKLGVLSTPRKQLFARTGNYKRVCSSPPQRTPKRPHKASPSPGKRHKRTSFKDEVVQLIKASKYERALHTMYNAPNCAVKRAFQNFLAKVTQSEVRTSLRLPAEKSVLCAPFNQKNLASFKWSTAIHEMKQSMPMTVSMLTALFPAAKLVSKQAVVGRRGSKRLLIV